VPTSSTATCMAVFTSTGYEPFHTTPFLRTLPMETNPYWSLVTVKVNLPTGVTTRYCSVTDCWIAMIDPCTLDSSKFNRVLKDYSFSYSGGVEVLLFGLGKERGVRYGSTYYHAGRRPYA